MTSRAAKTIEAFGDEWHRFDQLHLSDQEFEVIYNSYFSVLPKHCINIRSSIADVGAGSGRFAQMNARKCMRLVAFEPSKAVELCRKKLSSFSNATVIKATIEQIPSEFENNFDLVYCLGVLHHTDSIRCSLEKVCTLVKPAGYILLYIYYNFDNRSHFFKTIWVISNIVRLIVARLPQRVKYVVSDVLAVLVYFPLAKISAFAEALGLDVASIPLSTYRKYSFKTMRTDSLDRFGTRIEHRMSREQLAHELSRLGFVDIKFSEKVPFWTVSAMKA
jgi:SAM-dependent methyltransferase